MRSLYADQFAFVFQLSKSDAFTYIEPQYPRYELNDIGVELSAFVLPISATTEFNKYNDSNVVQLINAWAETELSVGKLAVLNAVHF